MVEPGGPIEDRSRDAHEMLRYADELHAWAGAVEDAAIVVAGVVAALPGAWADAVGREWTERLRLVGTELARRAEEAEHLARGAERSAGAPDVGVRFGVRLGGQAGTRVTESRGVVVPVLPPP